MDSWSRKIEEKDVRTDSGIRIFKPQTWKAPLESAADISAIRHALATDGIVLVENALQSDAIKMGLASLENDLRRATAGYLMKEVARQLPDGHVTQADLSRALSAMTGSVSHVPPAEQGPIDGVLSEHRLPLTTCAQLRRVNPDVRRVFAQIYGVDDEAMIQTPDSARVILHKHLASRSSTSCMGMSPQQIMHRKLNGTWQAPYRNDSYLGYGDDLKRRLGKKAGVKFGIMGLIQYHSVPCGELKKNHLVSVGPCLVTLPGAKRESMRRVHVLPDFPTTKAARRQATRRMQVLTDEELEENIENFACILAPAGSLILWRRDLPVAFKMGDPAAAGEPDAGLFAYASQQVSWVPRHAQSPNERRSSLRLFETKSRSTHLYEMPAPSRAKLRRKKSSWRMRRKRKRKESESDDAYNDIPVEHCELLLVQKQSL